jgi:hypothetical protein
MREPSPKNRLLVRSREADLNEKGVSTLVIALLQLLSGASATSKAAACAQIPAKVRAAYRLSP